MVVELPLLLVFAIVVAIFLIVTSIRAQQRRMNWRTGQRMCRACGVSQPATARFCRRCGRQL